jgi:hypothetical protein
MFKKMLENVVGQEITKIILGEIGNRNFTILIDESRDVFVKEQMAAILR